MTVTTHRRATWSERAADAIRRSRGAVPLTGNPNATLRRLWRVGCWVEQRIARRRPPPLAAVPGTMPVDRDDLNRLYDRLEEPWGSR